MTEDKNFYKNILDNIDAEAICIEKNKKITYWSKGVC